MTPNRVQVAIEKFGDKIPSSDMPQFRDKLEHAPNECMDTFMFTPTKSPVVALILSIFLGGFGVDRFYLGDVGYGLLKIFLPIILSFVNTGISIVVPPLGIFTSLLLYISIFVWRILEIIAVYKDAKIINYERLSSCLISFKSNDDYPYSYSQEKHSSNIDTTSYEEYEASNGEYKPLISAYRPVTVNQEDSQATAVKPADEPVKETVHIPEPVNQSSLNIIFTCPVCGQKMRITTVASKYCCPSCMTIYPYKNVVKN